MTLWVFRESNAFLCISLLLQGHNRPEVCRGWNSRTTQSPPTPPTHNIFCCFCNWQARASSSESFKVQNTNGAIWSPRNQTNEETKGMNEWRNEKNEPMKKRKAALSPPTWGATLSGAYMGNDNGDDDNNNNTGETFTYFTPYLSLNMIWSRYVRLTSRSICRMSGELILAWVFKVYETKKKSTRVYMKQAADV